MLMMANDELARLREEVQELLAMNCHAETNAYNQERRALIAEERLRAVEAERDAIQDQCAEWQRMANEQEQRAIQAEAERDALRALQET